VHHYAVYDTSEKSLREAVLIRRVDEFVDKLLVNNQRIEVDPSGERYQTDLRGRPSSVRPVLERLDARTLWILGRD
jgi:hypothetical protein